ncbi:MAG: histidine phosphatase family protein [Synergistaceae bacterium]|jgi:alpha-ribazole phosphatase/probable phosphoglycerate mutase|nr:histidine phosphatase family protein [Synergistaceae bacterium]
MDSDERPARIFFVRHGQTDWNRTLRYQGSTDMALNENGRSQARKAGLRLSRVIPCRVFSSPMLRAYGTAEAITEAGAADAPIETMDDLREISFGEWEGLTYPEIIERHASDYRAWTETPFSSSPTGGESFESVRTRSARAAEAVKSACAPGAAILVVAHGIVLRALLSSLADAGDSSLIWRAHLDNCSVSALDLSRGGPSLAFLNDTNHLRLDDEKIGILSFPG